MKERLLCAKRQCPALLKIKKGQMTSQSLDPNQRRKEVRRGKGKIVSMKLKAHVALEERNQGGENKKEQWGGMRGTA